MVGKRAYEIKTNKNRKEKNRLLITQLGSQPFDGYTI